MSTPVLLAFLSALAGGIHVFAPDHWVPASILCWQRRWRLPTSLLFVTCLLTLHVLVGAGVYFSLIDFFSHISPGALYLGTLIFALLVMLARALRFPRIHEFQRSGSNSLWQILSVVAFIGPCESILPILVKSGSIGQGYLVPLASFLGGTLFSGCFLTLSGRLLWNRPLLLPRVFGWVHQRAAILPVLVGVAFGLRYLIRLG